MGADAEDLEPDHDSLCLINKELAEIRFIDTKPDPASLLQGSTRLANRFLQRRLHKNNFKSAKKNKIIVSIKKGVFNIKLSHLICLKYCTIKITFSWCPEGEKYYFIEQ